MEAALIAAAIACGQLPTRVIPAYGWWAVLGVALSFIDVAVHRLPDQLTWPAMMGFLLLAGIAVPHGSAQAWLRAAFSALAVFLALRVCTLLWPGGLGRGDAKYGGAIGAAAGWMSWFAVYAAIVAATLLGAVVGTVLLITHRASRGTRVAFGPFLLTGALLVVTLLHF